MRWKQLTSLAELDQLIEQSESSNVLILKHSTRCNVSGVALNRLERNWKDEDDLKVVPYFLDLLAYRNVSNAVENRFGVEHESPQVLIIRNGKCFYSATHSDINYDAILDQVK